MGFGHISRVSDLPKWSIYNPFKRDTKVWKFRAFNLKPLDQLNHIVPIRKGSDAIEISNKTGIPQERFIEYGIRYSAIELATLRTALEKEIPAGLRLRAETRNIDNAFRAIIGRLGDEAFVFVPFDLAATIRPIIDFIGDKSQKGESIRELIRADFEASPFSADKNYSSYAAKLVFELFPNNGPDDFRNPWGDRVILDQLSEVFYGRTMDRTSLFGQEARKVLAYLRGEKYTGPDDTAAFLRSHAGREGLWEIVKSLPEGK